MRLLSRMGTATYLCPPQPKVRFQRRTKTVMKWNLAIALLMVSSSPQELPGITGSSLNLVTQHQSIPAMIATKLFHLMEHKLRQSNPSCPTSQFLQQQFLIGPQPSQMTNSRLLWKRNLSARNLKKKDGLILIEKKIPYVYPLSVCFLCICTLMVPVGYLSRRQQSWSDAEIH